MRREADLELRTPRKAATDPKGIAPVTSEKFAYTMSGDEICLFVADGVIDFIGQVGRGNARRQRNRISVLNDVAR